MNEREKIQKAYEESILNEGIPKVKLVFSGYHLKDNILDDITVEELQDMIVSNIPAEKLDNRAVMKEFETLLRMKVKDARDIAKKVIPELVKDIMTAHM